MLYPSSNEWGSSVHLLVQVLLRLDSRLKLFFFFSFVYVCVYVEPSLEAFNVYVSILLSSACTLSWEFLSSQITPNLSGLYSTLIGVKYFIGTCTVIDSELWFCVDNIFFFLHQPLLVKVVYIRSVVYKVLPEVRIPQDKLACCFHVLLVKSKLHISMWAFFFFFFKAVLHQSYLDTEVHAFLKGRIRDAEYTFHWFDRKKKYYLFPLAIFWRTFIFTVFLK